MPFCHSAILLGLLASWLAAAAAAAAAAPPPLRTPVVLTPRAVSDPTL
jgi:hypothetical protein